MTAILRSKALPPKSTWSPLWGPNMCPSCWHGRGHVQMLRQRQGARWTLNQLTGVSLSRESLQVISVILKLERHLQVLQVYTVPGTPDKIWYNNFSGKMGGMSRPFIHATIYGQYTNEKHPRFRGKDGRMSVFHFVSNDFRLWHLKFSRHVCGFLMSPVADESGCKEGHNKQVYICLQSKEDLHRAKISRV